MSCARTRTSVGPPRWTWRSTCSTACWTSDARTMSASPDPKRGWGHCARCLDPCNTASAAVVISEIGLDMSRFPSAAHLISWAGLCPKNDESAGKRRSTRLRPGAPWLKALLVQSAWCAVRTKATYLHALFQRLKARRGPRKAIVAVAAAMLTAIYHMLKRGTFYQDLGPDHLRRA